MLDAELAFGKGRSVAAGRAGGSRVMESGESKRVLLTVVFKQSAIARSANNALRVANKRTEVPGEDARDKEHQHERE